MAVPLVRGEPGVRRLGGVTDTCRTDARDGTVPVRGDVTLDEPLEEPGDRVTVGDEAGEDRFDPARLEPGLRGETVRVGDLDDAADELPER